MYENILKTPQRFLWDSVSPISIRVSVCNRQFLTQITEIGFGIVNGIWYWLGGGQLGTPLEDTRGLGSPESLLPQDGSSSRLFWTQQGHWWDSQPYSIPIHVDRGERWTRWEKQNGGRPLVVTEWCASAKCHRGQIPGSCACRRHQLHKRSPHIRCLSLPPSKVKQNDNNWWMTSEERYHWLHARTQTASQAYRDHLAQYIARSQHRFCKLRWINLNCAQHKTDRGHCLRSCNFFCWTINTISHWWLMTNCPK